MKKLWQFAVWLKIHFKKKARSVVPGSARADICPIGYLLGKDRVLE